MKSLEILESAYRTALVGKIIELRWIEIVEKTRKGYIIKNNIFETKVEPFIGQPFKTLTADIIGIGLLYTPAESLGFEEVRGNLTDVENFSKPYLAMSIWFTFNDEKRNVVIYADEKLNFDLTYIN